MRVEIPQDTDVASYFEIMNNRGAQLQKHEILKSFMSLYNYKAIPVEETSAGMVLSRTDTLFMQQSRVKGLPDISDETLRSRITADEAESIKRWGKSKYGKPQVTIVRKIPFAAFLSVGTIVYFLVGVLQFCGLL